MHVHGTLEMAAQSDLPHWQQCLTNIVNHCVSVYVCRLTGSKILTEALCETKQAVDSDPKSAILSIVTLGQYGQVLGALAGNSSRMLLQCTVYPGPTGDSR